MGNELPKGWKCVKLSDLSEIQSGGTPSRSNSSYWNGNIPWVKISDIKGKYITETFSSAERSTFPIHKATI